MGEFTGMSGHICEEMKQVSWRDSQRQNWNPSFLQTALLLASPTTHS